MLVVGDDQAKINEVAADSDAPLLGYVCPTSVISHEHDTREVVAAMATDGGRAFQDLDWLGGLSRIKDVLIEYTVDTAVFAFEQTDRAECFGTLDACYEHGVAAKVHRDHADQVLTADEDVGTIVDVDLKPWDVQDYLLKRGFDILVAAGGLLALSPVILAIAIKLDDGSPILYRQQRTAVFGGPFTVAKFRSMTPEEPRSRIPKTTASRPSAVFSGGHISMRSRSCGRFSWGKMSVVGPRAVWTEEEEMIKAQAQSWQQRWFVNPGLTGLSQINDARSTEPTE